MSTASATQQGPEMKTLQSTSRVETPSLSFSASNENYQAVFPGWPQHYFTNIAPLSAKGVTQPIGAPRYNCKKKKRKIILTIFCFYLVHRRPGARECDNRYAVAGMQKKLKMQTCNRLYFALHAGCFSCRTQSTGQQRQILCTSTVCLGSPTLTVSSRLIRRRLMQQLRKRQSRTLPRLRKCQHPSQHMTTNL